MLGKGKSVYSVQGYRWKDLTFFFKTSLFMFSLVFYGLFPTSISLNDRCSRWQYGHKGNILHIISIKDFVGHFFPSLLNMYQMACK